jgi:multisubunit Na+/H+ antiporter MnhE subunit
MAYWLRYGFAWWLGFLPLYLLFAASLSWQEFVAGVVVSGIAALALTATRRAGNLHFEPRLGWLRKFWHLPIRVLADCGIVAAALMRALMRREKIEGVFRTIPFDPGGDDAESAARRALVMAGACLAPNTYVVAVDPGRKQMVVHQLVPSPRPPGGGDPEWPL